MTTPASRLDAVLDSQDLYCLLLDIQNHISAPGHAAMANSALLKIDAARKARRLALTDSATPFGIDDVIAWADGVSGAFGTEHAGKITPREAHLASVILKATAPDDLFRDRTMQGDEVP